MTTINGYIGFNGKCREAMEFYKDCFGGQLDMNTVDDSPMKDQFPNMKGQILHSALTNDSLVIMGTDCVSPAGFHPGNNVALSLNCSSEEEINTFYKKLSEGGKVVDDLKEQFWGALFAVVIDKYGLNWMMNYNKPS